MGCYYTVEQMTEVERQWSKLHGSTKIIARHDNEHDILKYGYKCANCSDPLFINLHSTGGSGDYVTGVDATCPTCKGKRSFCVLNVYPN